MKQRFDVFIKTKTHIEYNMLEELLDHTDNKIDCTNDFEGYQENIVLDKTIEEVDEIIQCLCYYGYLVEVGKTCIYHEDNEDNEENKENKQREATHND